MLGTMVAKFSADAILIAVGACAAVSLALTLFALQTKWDFTGKARIISIRGSSCQS